MDAAQERALAGAGTPAEAAEAAAGCRACELWRRGTQTVFGAGPSRARLLLVGEQPGDREDLAGEPFVGPAGRLLDEALAEAGIDRGDVYLTNAVKHFKWRPAGKRRIHDTPSWTEIKACRPWLELELALVRPDVVVLLGATAAQSLARPRVPRHPRAGPRARDGVRAGRRRHRAPVGDPARPRRRPARAAGGVRRGPPHRARGAPAAGGAPPMSASLPPGFEALIETMKRAAAALRDAEVPALLGGGLAAWARGGPPTEHDVDFFVRPRDADAALGALAAAGMRPERPPEGWLLKAWDGDVLVDLIFRPSGGPIGDGHFERADRIEVMAQPLLVASLDDVLATKLLAISEQQLDYGSVLELARALREQVDWDAVRERTDGSPYAAAFFTLVERLGVVAAPGAQEGARQRPVAFSTDT